MCVIDLTGYSVEITDLLSEATKKVRKSEKYHFFNSLSLFCRNRHLLRNVNYIKCNFEDLLVLVKFISKYAFHVYEK